MDKIIILKGENGIEVEFRRNGNDLHIEIEGGQYYTSDPKLVVEALNDVLNLLPSEQGGE
jgi:hypothetical protein